MKKNRIASWLVIFYFLTKISKNIKKIGLLSLMLISISFSSFANTSTPKHNKWVLKKKIVRCNSGLITKGSKVVGYWMGCDGGPIYIRVY